MQEHRQAPPASDRVRVRLRRHVMSIFCGPTTVFADETRALSIVPMYGIDRVAAVPCDLECDVQFANLMVGLFERAPKFGLLAPCCTYWSKMQDMNAKDAPRRARLEAARAQQREILQRLVLIGKAFASWGGILMIENPATSKIWKEPAMAELRATTPAREWRYAKLNFCRVGGPHFKAMRFMTNAPQWANEAHGVDVRPPVQAPAVCRPGCERRVAHRRVGGVSTHPSANDYRGSARHCAGPECVLLG